MVGEVGRPQVLVALGVGCRPGGAVGESRADILPGSAVGRCLQANTVGCEGRKIGAIGLLDHGWVVDESITFDRARIDISLLKGRCQGAESKDTAREKAA